MIQNTFLSFEVQGPCPKFSSQVGKEKPFTDLNPGHLDSTGVRCSTAKATLNSSSIDAK